MNNAHHLEDEAMECKQSGSLTHAGFLYRSASLVNEKDNNLNLAIKNHLNQWYLIPEDRKNDNLKWFIARLRKLTDGLKFDYQKTAAEIYLISLEYKRGAVLKAKKDLESLMKNLDNQTLSKHPLNKRLYQFITKGSKDRYLFLDSLDSKENDGISEKLLRYAFEC
jgi:hypothetical protein